MRRKNFWEKKATKPIWIKIKLPLSSHADFETNFDSRQADFRHFTLHCNIPRTTRVLRFAFWVDPRARWIQMLNGVNVSRAFVKVTSMNKMKNDFCWRRILMNIRAEGWRSSDSIVGILFRHHAIFHVPQKVKVRQGTCKGARKIKLRIPPSFHKH